MDAFLSIFLIMVIPYNEQLREAPFSLLWPAAIFMGWMKTKPEGKFCIVVTQCKLRYVLNCYEKMSGAVRFSGCVAHLSGDIILI